MPNGQGRTCVLGEEKLLDGDGMGAMAVQQSEQFIGKRLQAPWKRVFSWGADDAEINRAGVATMVG